MRGKRKGKRKVKGKGKGYENGKGKRKRKGYGKRKDRKHGCKTTYDLLYKRQNNYTKKNHEKIHSFQ